MSLLKPSQQDVQALGREERFFPHVFCEAVNKKTFFILNRVVCGSLEHGPWSDKKGLKQ
jgi:hypothetical protein